MDATCRICDEPAVTTLGAYEFCARHRERATHARRGGWQADLASLVLLIAFVVAVYAADASFETPLAGLSLTLTGLLLAIVPAAVWLAFFYRRDRLEPEPRAMVFGIFVLGFLVASAIAIPVVEEAFDVGSWMLASPLVHLAGSILVVGVAQEGLKYLTVRWAIYGSPEFDEPTDGIIYGTAVGLGFATALNVAFVVGSGGVDLGSGAIRVVLTSLAHASFGGVMGYFLGRQKFEARPIWWMPAGVGLAAVLNGVFLYLRSTVGRDAIQGPLAEAAPWIGLGLAAALAASVTAILSTLIRRHLAQMGVADASPETSS